jgi:hypothetical protein
MHTGEDMHLEEYGWPEWVCACDLLPRQSGYMSTHFGGLEVRVVRSDLVQGVAHFVRGGRLAARVQEGRKLNAYESSLTQVTCRGSQAITAAEGSTIRVENKLGRRSQPFLSVYKLACFFSVK